MSSPKKSLANLRSRIREQATEIQNTGLGLGSAFALGYLQQRGTLPSQVMNVDTTLLVGGAGLAYAMSTRGKQSDAIGAVARSALAVWAYGYGQQKAAEGFGVK